MFSVILNLPTLASTKAVLTVTKCHQKQSLNLDTVIYKLAVQASGFIHLNEYKHRKLASLLKSAEIPMTPEIYVAHAWVKSVLIALCIIPTILLFPLLTPVIVLLAIAVYFREIQRAEEIVKQRREEIENELPRFVNTVAQELTASRDVLHILQSYQKIAGTAMKKELEITVADMTSGNEETALTRLETRVGSARLSEVIRGLISVKHGDNGVVYFQMLSLTFKQLEYQRLKLEAMKKPGKMRKYSFLLLGCFLLMYVGILGYEVVTAFGKMF